MRSNPKLKKSLNKYNKSKEDKPLMISGELGVTLGGRRTVEVAGREGFVYVKLKGNTSELIQAFNAEVAPVYGMPVFVQRSAGIYKVVGRNIDRYQNQLLTSAPFLPKHGAQHSFNHNIGVGGDIAWIYSQQFMPLLSYPSGSLGAMSLVIEPHFYEWNGQWRYSQTTGTPSYTPYLPTTTGVARMVLSYIDPSDNSIKLVPGTPFAASLTGSSEIVSYIPDIPREVGIPLAAVRLTTGTTTISWDAIYDLRDFYTVGKPSGSTGGGSGGISGIIAQDEGIILGTGTTFNFVGNNVEATISGSVVRVYISGVGGAGSAFLVTEDLTPYISGSNQVFPLAAVPTANTLRLFYNGVRQRPTYHYSVAGQQVNTVFVPTTGSVLIADYNEASTTGSASAITVQDEGTPLGTADTINFVGTPVSVTLAGSTARVFVTGSSSASTGALVYISTTTVTGTATLAITSGIDSTYDEYEIHLELNVSTDGTGITGIVSTNGGTSWITGSSYKYGGTIYYSNNFAQNVTSDTASNLYFAGEVGNQSDEGYAGIFRLYNPNSTTKWKRFSGKGSYSTQHPYFVDFNGSLANTTTSAINAIRFQPGAGTISGRAFLYGVKRS